MNSNQLSRNIFLSFFILFNALYLQASLINFERIGAAEGLSQISVMSIYQDEIGQIWFGTRLGLNKYDGNEIEVIQLQDMSERSFSYNVVNKIVGDDNGTLYLQCDYNKLLTFNLRNNELTRIDTVCHAIAKGNLHVFLASEGKIYKSKQGEQAFEFFFDTKISSLINVLYEDRAGNIYIGAANGLYILDKRLHLRQLLFDENVVSIFEDKRQNIWIGTFENGLFQMNNERVTKYYHEKTTPALSSKIIREIIEDNDGNIWIASFLGLNKLNPTTDEIEYIPGNTQRANDLSHSSVYSLLKDNQGTIWIGTYYGGVNYFNPETTVFNYYYPENKNDNTINFPFVGNFAEDSDGIIWICTEGGGLNKYNPVSKKFTYYTSDMPNSVTHNNLKAIWYNKKNNSLYIGTHGNGLDIFNLTTQEFRNINLKKAPVLKNNSVVSIEFIGNDSLLIVTKESKVVLNTLTEEIEILELRDNHGAKIETPKFRFLYDSKGHLWFDSDKGIVQYNLKTKEAKFYNLISSNSHAKIINQPIVNMMFESRNGNIYFATHGAGLMSINPQTEKISRYTLEENDLLSNYIFNIEETSDGQMILLSNKGLNFYDVSNNKSRHFDKEHGFPIEMGNMDCGLFVSSRNEIFAGSINGMVSLMESDIRENQKEFRIYFSEIILNEGKVLPSEENPILQENLIFTDQIKLKHKQNNFSIRYATTNYIKSERRSFEYKLEGFDQDWTVSLIPSIRYTNLKPGKYTLRVREKGGNSEFVDEAKLNILIKPPYYATIYACLFYVIALLSILWGILKFNMTRVALRTSLEYEKREKEQIIELNQSKLQFFTNISHEFRTPLTLIVGQIDSILSLENVSGKLKDKLLSAQRNANQLRKLINELLDFRKQEFGNLKINVSQQDIVRFTKDVFQLFEDNATQRGMTYQFVAPSSAVNLWFDTQQMNKVLLNLLSNAFKYANDNGTIILTIENQAKHVVISVKDTGIGIPEKDLDKIFERYYQADNQKSVIGNVFSTGVGLALTKNIVEQHHGTISVQNNQDIGTTFKVMLLKGNQHFSENQIVYNTDETDLSENKMTDKVQGIIEKIVEESKDTLGIESTILIVEDNEDMLQFLTEIFEPIYHVDSAMNGKEALDIIKVNLPDIILSDVMMPIMDGVELCEKLKNNFETSHIPIVMLTADSSEEQKLKGLKIGADDFITKPFDVEILIRRCNNLVLNRKRIKERFLHEEMSAKPLIKGGNKTELEFINKATSIIQKHMANTDFNVGVLAEEMAMGKSKLYSDVKEFTDMTPNDFIQTIRLKEAAKLLKEQADLNISDIAYRVGFSTPRYFSQLFKGYFGLTPVNYRKQIMGE